MKKYLIIISICLILLTIIIPIIFKNKALNNIEIIDHQINTNHKEIIIDVN